MTMKRRRSPDVPTPVIVVASLAAGAALAWWYSNRSATSAVQPLVTAAHNLIGPAASIASTSQALSPYHPSVTGDGITGGGASVASGQCPPGMSMQWSSVGRGGQQSCRPIANEVIARAEAAAGRALTREEQTAALAAAGVVVTSFEPNREYLA